MTDEQLKAVNAAFNKHQIYRLDDIKEANRKAGYFFFSKDTLRFFNSRFDGQLFAAPSATKILFVSSERNSGAFGSDANKRLYTIRVFDVAKSTVDTLGDHQGYATLRTAKKHAQELSLTM